VAIGAGVTVPVSARSSEMQTIGWDLVLAGRHAKVGGGGWHSGVASGKSVRWHRVLLLRGEDSSKGGRDECCVARRGGRVCRAVGALRSG